MSTFKTGLWRLADPKISLASFASMFLGTALAAAQGPIAWGWTVITVLGIFAIEVAKNASGEIFDFDSGTDLDVRPEERSPFSGGKRVLVDAILSRGETRAIAVAGYAVGAVCGLIVVMFRESGILWIGVVGTAIAYFYHAPPLRLSYRGWGELAVAVCYGPLVCLGTYWVQRGVPEMSVVIASLPLGLLVAAFLWINEVPDYRADLGNGKKNLVVRLGRDQAGRVFAGIVWLAHAVLAIAVWRVLPVAGILAFLPLPLFLRAATRLRRSPSEVPHIIPAQQWTLLGFVAHAILLGLAVWLA